MIIAILILVFGILIVNLYFYKAVCKSNKDINSTIDKIDDYLKDNIKPVNIKLNNLYNNLDRYLKSRIIADEDNMKIIYANRQYLEDIKLRIISLANKGEYDTTAILLTKEDLTDIVKIIEKLDTSTNLVNTKLSKLIKNANNRTTANIKWQENVAKELAKIHCKIMETNKAVIS